MATPPLPALAAELLTTWFGVPGDEHHGRFRSIWFSSTPAFDEQLQLRFGEALAAARAGGLREWEAAGAEGALARIILLDQVSRNVHRGTALAFAGDVEVRGASDAPEPRAARAGKRGSGRGTPRGC